MPWKVDRVTQRAEMVALIRADAFPVAELCRRYGVSRKTAYKWLKRYEAGGLGALEDASRAPRHQPHKTPARVEAALLAARERFPLWGARKLRAWLATQRPELALPSASTCHGILDRHGLVPRRPRRAPRSDRTPDVLTIPEAPNHVWSVDFKGQFRLGDRSLCYPLTVQDAFSRLLLRCDALPGTQRAPVQEAFEKAFRRYGLPEVIRSDNGSPFAATAGALGWSRLSVWFHRLGITHERTRPSSPQQNGRHERMHRTLKKHTAKPPRATQGAQQRCFDAFRREFNEVRPHEAHAMATPSSVYTPSPRKLPKTLPTILYPGHFEIRRVSRKGMFAWRTQSIYVSESFEGQTLGLDETDDGLWSVHFGSKWLGYLWEQRVDLGLIRPGSSVHKRLLPMCPNDL